MVTQHAAALLRGRTPREGSRRKNGLMTLIADVPSAQPTNEIEPRERCHGSRRTCEQHEGQRLLARLQAGQLVQRHRCARFHSSQRHALHRRRRNSWLGPSKRTKAVWAKLQPFFQEEQKRGVLAVDAKTPSTMLAHKAGYIDRDNEVIVGLQTDQPFKRAIFPFGGLRMVEAGLKAAGFEADPQVHEAFTKYRKSHNDGVFDAYTPEIMRCRKSGIITGLPDAYGRGRIIGDYRRVALYGVDRLIEAKQAGTRADR